MADPFDPAILAAAFGDEPIHDRITRERKDWFPDASETIPKFRDYYASRHPSTLTKEQRALLGPQGNKSLADNALKAATNVIAGRLDFTGWKTDDEAVQQFLDELFAKNKLADAQFDAHVAVIRDGNHAALLSWLADDAPATDGAQSGRVLVQRLRWWDGKSGVFVGYGDDGRPVYGVREWEVYDPKRNRKIDRRTVYLPDRIMRYWKDTSGWKPLPTGDDPESWRQDWRKQDGSPIGLAVVHLPSVSVDDSSYGQSDYVGLLGLQDQLNDSQRDIAAGARLTGFQMITATGYQAEVDPMTNRERPLIVGPGRMLTAKSSDAKFGTIAPAELTNLIEVSQHARQTVAHNMEAPEHMLTGGEWPSGLALMRAEQPLVTKVRHLARKVGPAWQEVGHRATELVNTFGSGGLDEAALITAMFSPPERLDDQAQAEVDKAVAEVWAAISRITDRTLLLKTGLLTEQEVDALLQERKQRADEEAQRAAQLPALASF